QTGATTTPASATPAARRVTGARLGTPSRLAGPVQAISSDRAREPEVWWRATTVCAVSNPFADWIAAYETAWRREGTASLRRVFSEDATFRAAPFEEPRAGVEAIARFWEDERDGPDEVFTLTSEIVAAEGDTAVARLEIVYGDPSQRTYRDLWII